MQARRECSQTEGKACAEAPKWQSLACLMIREVFLPFHQSFVKLLSENHAPFLQITSLGL